MERSKNSRGSIGYGVKTAAAAAIAILWGAAAMILFLLGPATRWCSHILLLDPQPPDSQLSLNPLHASYMLVQPPYSHSTRSPIPLIGDPQPATHWCCHQTLTRPATRRCGLLLDPLHAWTRLHDVQPPHSLTGPTSARLN